MQHQADFYLPLNYCTCFGRPSSGVHRTVVAASGTDHNIWGVSFLIWSCSRQLAPQVACSVPEAPTTVYALLMMGEMDARNMQINLALNKYLHTHMVRHPRCVFINYTWINQLSNTTIWWLDICCLLHRYQLRVSALMAIFRLTV